MIKQILITTSIIALLTGCGSTKSKKTPSQSLDSLSTSFESQGDTVYFKFDNTDLSAADITTLDKQAEWLQNNSDVAVEIEGHCDARGTREYNIILGEKRAFAVKKHLVKVKGVNAERISTISYGKERPAVVGDDEEAFAMNRRAVTILNK